MIDKTPGGSKDAPMGNPFECGDSNSTYGPGKEKGAGEVGNTEPNPYGPTFPNGK